MTEKKETAREKSPHPGDPEPGDLVDGPFGKRIFVQYDKPQKHNHFALPDGHLAFCVNGTTGSGKSTVICSFLPFIANLSQVLILSTIGEETNKAYQAVHAWCDKNSIQYDIADTPKEARLKIASFKEQKPENTFGIIILDDFNVQKSGRDEPFNNISAVIAAMLRNYGYHCVFVCQSSQGVPTSIRNNTNVKIMFRMNEEHSIRIARTDFLNSGVLKTREEFDSLFAIIQKIDHSYLMLDRSRGKLFIYIPPGNEGGAPDIQPVEFGDSTCSTSLNGVHAEGNSLPSVKERIMNEPGLMKQIEEYRALQNKGPLNKIKSKKIYSDLQNYLIYMAHRFHIDLEELQDELRGFC